MNQNHPKILLPMYLKNKPIVLVLGASGLIGSTLYNFFCKKEDLNVFGTSKSTNQSNLTETIIEKIDFLNLSQSLDIISEIKPSVVINCIGITKHSPNYSNLSDLAFLNSLLPHILSDFSRSKNFRFIHISSDCVFDGQRGNYSESDCPDSKDLYGKSKFLGELNDINGSVTIRTSTIGHEKRSKYGLLEWFLSQNVSCKGFSKAFFSGLTTLELADLLYKYFIFDDSVCGLYNLAGPKINKFDLLEIIARVYKKDIEIEKDDTFCIDRTLNASKFNNKFGYSYKNWDSMIKEMKEDTVL